MDTNTRQKTPKFSFIIVNYHSAALLPACFSSFQNIILPKEYECIVVNNDPSEESVLLSLKERFSFTLVSLAKNHGFGFAANRGAEYAKGDILIFLNPDARFLSGNMQDIASIFKQYPSVGIVGMRLLIEPEKPQPWSAGKHITLVNIFRNHLGLSASTSLWNTKKSRSVTWVSGAALVIPRALFFQIHGFDKRFFLYYEDVDLCTRTRKLHKKIVFTTRVSILHRGGGSMEHSREQQKREYYISQDQYFALHRPRHERFLLAIFRKIFFL
ncbi:MAG: glycosyltransferase family 2 protein [Candidatus Moraniibacteriota bacterium]